MSGARRSLYWIGFKEGTSREEKKNRWRVEKLEAVRESWALLGSFAFGSG